MLNKALRAVDTEMVIFSSKDYNGDTENLQDALNSWCRSQPDDITIDDIIYRHCGVNRQGKDILSLLIVSSRIRASDEVT